MHGRMHCLLCHLHLPILGQLDICSVSAQMHNYWDGPSPCLNDQSKHTCLSWTHTSHFQSLITPGNLLDDVPGTQCHHIVVEDWNHMEQPHGTLFVSIPSVLDSSLCPDGTHIVHIFTPDWLDQWQVRPCLLEAAWSTRQACGCLPAADNPPSS